MYKEPFRAQLALLEWLELPGNRAVFVGKPIVCAPFIGHGRCHVFEFLFHAVQKQNCILKKPAKFSAKRKSKN